MARKKKTTNENSTNSIYDDKGSTELSHALGDAFGQIIKRDFGLFFKILSVKAPLPGPISITFLLFIFLIFIILFIIFKSVRKFWPKDFLAKSIILNYLENLCIQLSFLN